MSLDLIPTGYTISKPLRSIPTEAPKLFASSSISTVPDFVGPPRPPSQQDVINKISAREKELANRYSHDSTIAGRAKLLLNPISHRYDLKNKAKAKLKTAASKVYDYTQTIKKISPKTYGFLSHVGKPFMTSGFNIITTFNEAAKKVGSRPLAFINKTPIFHVSDVALKSTVEKVKGTKGMTLGGLSTKSFAKIGTAIIEPIPALFEATATEVVKTMELKGLRLVDKLILDPYKIQHKYGTAKMRAGLNENTNRIKKEVLGGYSDLYLLNIAAGAEFSSDINKYRKEARELLSDRLVKDPPRALKLKTKWINKLGTDENKAGFIGRVGGYATGAALTSGAGSVGVLSRQVAQTAFVARSESPKEVVTNLAVGAVFGVVGRGAQTAKGFLQRVGSGRQFVRGAVEGTSYAVEHALKPYLTYKLATGVTDIGSNYIYGDKKMAYAKERHLTTALATIPLGKSLGRKLFDKSVGLVAYDPNVYVEPMFPSRDRAQIARAHLQGKVMQGTRAETPFGKFNQMAIRDPAAVKGKGVTYDKQLAFVNPKLSGSQVQPVGSYFISKSAPTSLKQAFSGQKSPRILKLKYQTPNLIKTPLGKNIISQLTSKGNVNSSTIKQYLKFSQALANKTGNPVGTLSPKTLKGMGSSPTEGEMTLLFPKGQGTPFGIAGTNSAGRSIDLPNLKFTGVSADTRTPVYKADFTKSAVIPKVPATIKVKSVSNFFKTSPAKVGSFFKTSSAKVGTLVGGAMERPVGVAQRTGNIKTDYAKLINLKLSVLTGKQKSIPNFYELNSKGLGHAGEVYKAMIKMRHDPTHPDYKTLNKFTTSELYKLALVHDAGQIGTTAGYFEHGKIVGNLINDGRINILSGISYQKQMMFAEAIGGHMAIAPPKALLSKVKVTSIVDIGKGLVSNKLSKALADADKIARAKGRLDTKLLFSRPGQTPLKRSTVKPTHAKSNYNRSMSAPFVNSTDYVETKPKFNTSSVYNLNAITSKVYRGADNDFMKNDDLSLEPKSLGIYNKQLFKINSSFGDNPIGYNNLSFKKSISTPFLKSNYDIMSSTKMNSNLFYNKSNTRIANNDYYLKDNYTNNDSYYNPKTNSNYKYDYKKKKTLDYKYDYKKKDEAYDSYYSPKVSNYGGYLNYNVNYKLYGDYKYDYKGVGYGYGIRDNYKIKTLQKPVVTTKQDETRDTGLNLKLAYRIKIKSDGKWATISTPKKLNYYAAHNRAMTIVDKYKERSYKLFKSSGNADVVRKTMPKLSSQFYRQSKSNNPTLTDTYIEKSKYAIDTPGELKGITYKGLQAIAKKKTKNKRKFI